MDGIIIQLLTIISSNWEESMRVCEIYKLSCIVTTLVIDNDLTPQIIIIIIIILQGPE